MLLFKGIDIPMYKTKEYAKQKLDVVLKGEQRNCVSWTDNEQNAKDWASNSGFGYLISAKIPVNKILISHHGSYILEQAGEDEFVVEPLKVTKELYNVETVKS